MDNLDFKRELDESIEHFIWRVYKYGYKTKLIEKEEAGDICRKELGLEFDESAFRKKYEAFDKMWQEVKDEYLIDTDEELLERLSKMEELEDELYKIKTRARMWVNTKRTLLRDEARGEELKDILRECIYDLEPLPVKVVDKPLGSANTAIQMISDLHYGIEIDNFWNKYNTDIARDRIDSLASDIVKYCKLMNVNELYLANLNDLLSGGLHLTTRLFESVDTVQQAIAVGEIISNMMASIQNEGIKVNYISTTDNHSRRSTNFRESVEGDSWVKIVDEFIRLRVGDNINILENVFDEQIAYFEIGDRKIFAVHGHRDKPKMVVQNMIDATNIIPTHVLMGHYHSKSGFQKANTKVFVNGSIVGVDQYAKDCRYFNKPSQTMVVFDGDNEIDIDIKL